MTGYIGDRLERAIRDEDEKSLGRLRASHQSARGAEEKFKPVRQAAEELGEQLLPLPSIALMVNSDNVWLTLADRELKFSYDIHSHNFVGEEGAHSWHDGEPYADRYEWATANDCIDAMIRLCAKYVRMARAINAA